MNTATMSQGDRVVVPKQYREKLGVKEGDEVIWKEDARPQGQSETKALFNAFKQKRWQGEEERLVAERLRERMLKENLWRERSEKKRPEKDEPYQMTLTVLAVLGKAK